MDTKQYNIYQQLLSDYQLFKHRFPKQNKTVQCDDYQIDIEQLLQGTAFLASQVIDYSERSRDGFYQCLLQEIAPELVWPYASCCVFQVQADSLSEACVISGLDVADSDLSACVFYPDNVNNQLGFTPVFTSTVYPLQLSVTVDANSLLLQFTATNNMSIRQLDINSLLLFIDAPIALANKIYWYLLENVQSITFNSELSKISIDIVKPYDHDRAFFSLQHLFHYPQHFYFFNLHGLSKLLAAHDCDNFTISIEFFDNDFPDLQGDFIKLNCFSVMNVYQQDAVPIKFDGTKVQYPLLFDNEQHLYHINDITGFDIASNNTYKYRSCVKHDGSDHCYQLYIDDSKACLGFNSAVDNEQVITCGALVCDHDNVIASLHGNERWQWQHIMAYSISTFSKGLTSSLFGRHQLQSLYQLQIDATISLEQFKTISQICNWHGQSYFADIIEQITSITSNFETKQNSGVLYQCLCIHIIVNDYTINDKHALYLLGRCYIHFVTFYTFIQFKISLTISCSHSNYQFHWDAI